MKSIFLSLVTIFFSCAEYSSKYPVGHEIDSPLMKQVIGEWQFLCHFEDDQIITRSYNSHYLRIMPFNNHEYLIEYVLDEIEDIDTYFQETRFMRAFITKVDKYYIANIQGITVEEEEEINFIIHKFTVGNDTLIYTGISEKNFKNMHPEILSINEHYNFVRSIIEIDSVWNTKYIYVKKKSDILD
jgi:hypothetical protein